MMHWIGRGTLKVGSKFLKYGDEVDPKDLSPKLIEQLKKDGSLGVVPEPYDPDKHYKARVAELEAEVKDLKKKLKKANKAEKSK